MLRLYTVTFALLLGACSTVPERGTMLQGLDSQAAQPFGSAADCVAARGEATATRFWDDFCRSTPPPATVALTTERYRELEEVQRKVNAAIAYGTTTSWNPLARNGDCKTFAARKSLELLDRGWPAGALRIATAFVNDNSREQLAYHAVLLVDTDRGTIVLDNRQRRPRPWRELSYIWMTAQARSGNGGWSRLPSDPVEVKMALAANTVGAEASGAIDESW